MEMKTVGQKVKHWVGPKEKRWAGVKVDLWVEWWGLQTKQNKQVNQINKHNSKQGEYFKRAGFHTVPATLTKMVDPEPAMAL